MPAPDVHGPIDFVMLEFDSSVSGEATAAALRDLVEQGTVRLWDLMVVAKEADGSCVEVDLADTTDGRLDALSDFAGARSGLVGGSDLDDVASVLEPGALGVVLLYENSWAVPFVGAARAEGGQLVASSRLTAQQIMDALDAADTAG